MCVCVCVYEILFSVNINNVRFYMYVCLEPVAMAVHTSPVHLLIHALEMELPWSPGQVWLMKTWSLFSFTRLVSSRTG